MEVGLTAFAKRTYAPALGRWASPDPLAVHAPGEADLNLYAYVHGRVYAATDPLGLAEPDAGIAMPTGGPSLVEVAKSWWSSAKETASEWGKALDAKRIESREKFGPAPQGGLLGEVVDRSPAASGNAFLVMTASGPGRAPARAIVEKELSAPAPAAPVAPLADAAAAETVAVSNAIVPYYPANNGFLGAATETVLQPGQLIDRVGGSAVSRFFSPVGTPAAARALPPGTTGVIRTFEVLKPVDAQSGTIAPAFGQLGLGTQFRTTQTLGELLQGGFVREVLP